MRSSLAIAALLALSLVACQPAPTSPTATPLGATAPGGPAPVALATPQDALTPLSQQTIELAGLVGAVDARARTVTFADPNESFATVYLTPATRILDEYGKEAKFADLAAGQSVQVKGLPGKTGALIASQVTISHAY